MPGQRREPVPTPDTRHYWKAAARGVLALQRCVPCDRHYFYPRSHCPFCLGDQVEWTEASGRGVLHTYVISHVPTPGFDGPFVIAIVELEEGPRMMSNIVGVDPTPESLELDMPLQVEFEEVGETVVPQFRPVGLGA